MDLPGHGESPPLTLAGRRPVPAIAEELFAFFDELGLDRPHVAGNSLGGALALIAGARGRAATVTGLSPAGFWARDWEFSYAKGVFAAAHFAIPAASIPWADSSTICARRQVTTDPLPRRMIRTSRRPSSSSISRTRSRSVTGPVSAISTRRGSPGPWQQRVTSSMERLAARQDAADLQDQRDPCDNGPSLSFCTARTNMRRNRRGRARRT